MADEQKSDDTTLEQTTTSVEPSVHDIRAAQAENIRERASAAYLYSSMARAIGESLGPDAYKVYVDQLLADAGNPRDPIEVMLVEATALAFHNVGRLHMKSAAAEDQQVATAFAAAATKLTAEFRRLSLALVDYRSKAGSRLGVVKEDDEPESASKHVA